MATYIILTRMQPQTSSEPADFRKLAEKVSATIKNECPGVTWQQSYATMGSIDVVDIVEADDPVQVEKAAMIIRSLAKASTETMSAAPWKQFIDAL